MIDSNHTLRFNRTSREAYGHQIQFDHPYQTVEAWIYAGVTFLVGLLLGSLL
jgi:ElaB/YqjD/DUF883 family membrane-anchored ribosome-binding protein